MVIFFRSASSRLPGHLLMPVDAKLTIRGDTFQYVIENYLPRSLDDLRNISNITKVHFRITDYTRIKLSGQSGQLSIVSRIDPDRSGLEALGLLDTSKIERLEVANSGYHLMRHPYRGLIRLKNYTHPHAFSMQRPVHCHGRLVPHYKYFWRFALPRIGGNHFDSPH